MLVEGWRGVLLEGCRPCPDAAGATCSGVSWGLLLACCCCLRVSSLCSEDPSQTRRPHLSSCPERKRRGGDGQLANVSKLSCGKTSASVLVGGTCLLVKFEGVAKSVQTLRLLRVCVSKGLRRSFEEVLVVAHLGYWHAVELVWTGAKGNSATWREKLHSG